MKSTLAAFDNAQALRAHGARLNAVVTAARGVRDALLAESSVLAVRTLPLTHLPYPTQYAFQGSAWTPVPFVQMAHRCLLVQFREGSATRTLLFNPTDVIAARQTPFFADFIRKVGPFERFLAPRSTALTAQLSALGVNPEDVDYLAFDHFHTQDLRPVLARFPNATLLAPRTEWEDWDQLHPMQRAWYVADGKRGVDLQRVRLLDGSFHPGGGVALLATPGHTSGNQTLFVRTDRGIWGCSENGTSADCWSPGASQIPGLARFARKYHVDVLINSNTPELGAAQYTSMVAERTIVDPVADAPQFVQMLPSSEVTRSWMAPGARPTWLHHGITAGAVRSRPLVEVARARVA